MEILSRNGPCTGYSTLKSQSRRDTDFRCIRKTCPVRSRKFNNESNVKVTNTSSVCQLAPWNKCDATSLDITGMPTELKQHPEMHKYWMKRHSLFHRFDEGIQLDMESWFSVTPEDVARHIATKAPSKRVVDAFCGAGGNAIQFARVCEKVTAIDIDPVKIAMAKHNAKLYGVADRIRFIEADFFKIGPSLRPDMVFLSPLHGGPKYSQVRRFDLETMLQPKPASEVMEVTRKMSRNISLFIPRNSDRDQIITKNWWPSRHITIPEVGLPNSSRAVNAGWTELIPSFVV